MSQALAILSHLQSGKPITPIEALDEFGCFRLGARIWDLKRDGHPITTEIVTDPKTGKHFARYWLGENEGEQRAWIGANAWLP